VKVVIYTAITGGYDDLQENCDFSSAIPIAFMDKKPTYESRWNILKACDLFHENNRNAKIHKILAHQYFDCKYSLWMDGNIRLKVPVADLIKKYLADADIAVHDHPGWDNIFQEKKACRRLRKGDPLKLDKQIDTYKAEGFDKDMLFECPVILRRHTPITEKLNNYWWSEICKHSRRDQISFPYVVDKLGVKVNTFDGNVYDSPYFGWGGHK
jgi:hypothetical protein